VPGRRGDPGDRDAATGVQECSNCSLLLRDSTAFIRIDPWQNNLPRTIGARSVSECLGSHGAGKRLSAGDDSVLLSEDLRELVAVEVG
jgi:hypothetical protein